MTEINKLTCITSVLLLITSNAVSAILHSTVIPNAANDVPWLVQVVKFGIKNRILSSCSGTLVSADTVVTTFSCVGEFVTIDHSQVPNLSGYLRSQFTQDTHLGFQTTTVSNLIVIVGSRQSIINVDDIKKNHKYAVASVIVPTAFYEKKNWPQDNLAIIRLISEVPNAQPIRLPTLNSQNVVTGQPPDCHMVGFGDRVDWARVKSFLFSYNQIPTTTGISRGFHSSLQQRYNDAIVKAFPADIQPSVSNLDIIRMALANKRANLSLSIRSPGDIQVFGKQAKDNGDTFAISDCSNLVNFIGSSAVDADNLFCAGSQFDSFKPNSNSTEEGSALDPTTFLAYSGQDLDRLTKSLSTFKGPCGPRDIGAPMFCYDTERPTNILRKVPYLAAMVSYPLYPANGHSTCYTPYAYVNIAPYSEWIREVISVKQKGRNAICCPGSIAEWPNAKLAVQPVSLASALVFRSTTLKAVILAAMLFLRSLN